MSIPYASPATYHPGLIWKRRKRLVLAVAILFVAAFSWGVYPTLYRYETVNNTLIRINRFTGTPEMLSVSGWQELREAEQPWESHPIVGTAQPKP